MMKVVVRSSGNVLGVLGLRLDRTVTGDDCAPLVPILDKLAPASVEHLASASSRGIPEVADVSCLGEHELPTAAIEPSWQSSRPHRRSAAVGRNVRGEEPFLAISLQRSVGAPANGPIKIHLVYLALSQVAIRYCAR